VQKKNNADATWIAKDGKAQAIIIPLLEDNQFVHVWKQTTAKVSQEALKAHHQKSTLSNKST
jgi:hypothetical protein